MTTLAQEASFAADYELLQHFHARAYEGEELSQREIKRAHKAWWRLAEALETTPSLGAFVLLLHSMKYLPSTYDQDPDA